MMKFKKIIFILSFYMAANISQAQALLKFDKDTVDFGILKEGDTVKYDFGFTNIGNANLAIKQAWPSCGCTHPTFTQGEIKPGERGTIKVEFRSAGFGGQTVHKNIIIINNGAEQYANFTAKINSANAATETKAETENKTNKQQKLKRKKRKK